MGVTRPERQADRSAPPGAEFRDEWNHSSTRPFAFVACLLQLTSLTYIFKRNAIVVRRVVTARDE
jgi:hypothetical protein